MKTCRAVAPDSRTAHAINGSPSDVRDVTARENLIERDVDDDGRSTRWTASSAQFGASPGYDRDPCPLTDGSDGGTDKERPMGVLSELPIVQAPMAGGPSTPALTAAVSEAGGYGFLAGGYLSPDALNEAIAVTRTLVDMPFGVNLFVPSSPGDPAEIAAYSSTLQPEARRLGVTLGEGRWEDDDYAAKLDVITSRRVHLASFTFGCPTSEVVDRLH